MSETLECRLHAMSDMQSTSLMTSHPVSEDHGRDAFVQKTNLGERQNAESLLSLREAACDTKTSRCRCFCIYCCNMWVSGTIAIPERSDTNPLITLSKPVIPKVEFELNANEVKHEAEDTLSSEALAEGDKMYRALILAKIYEYKL